MQKKKRLILFDSNIEIETEKSLKELNKIFKINLFFKNRKREYLIKGFR